MIRDELWLGGLTLLFAFRVAVQLLQSLFSFEALPPFEAWHGGVLPYWLLLSAQLGLLGLMLWTVGRVAADAVAATRGKATVLLAFGSLYLATMTVRLVAGQSFLAESAWFAASLPALFHIVLALFLILLGHHHAVKASRPTAEAAG